VSAAHPKPRKQAARRAKASQHLLLAIPVEDVSVLLETMEETIENIEDSECDCDDCARALDVLRGFVGTVVATAPIKS
jgi:hypothetical protein